MLACDKLDDVTITITPHKSLNMVQGIIFHRDLLLQSDEELRKNLEWRGVHFIRPIYRSPKDERVATGAFILTFEGDSLPEKVKVMNYWCDVKPYVPPPMCCCKCWRFRHMSSQCDANLTCRECGCASHPDVPCVPSSSLVLTAANTIPPAHQPAQLFTKKG